MIPQRAGHRLPKRFRDGGAEQRAAALGPDPGAVFGYIAQFLAAGAEIVAHAVVLVAAGQHKVAAGGLDAVKYPPESAGIQPAFGVQQRAVQVGGDQFDHTGLLFISVREGLVRAVPLARYCRAGGNGRRRGSGSQSPRSATGRCSHRPGNPAIPQGPQAAGVNARPTLRPGTGGGAEAAVRRQAWRRGRCEHRPLRRGTALHDCHPPAMPAVHGCAARLPCIVGRAISPAGEVCGGVMLRFCASAAPQSSVMPQDRGSLRRPGRVLAGQGAASLSRLTPTLPVCGARIALRVLKHTCVLRPLHLLRLAVSAAGGARLRSSLQGSLLGGSRLQSLPCKGRWMRRKAQTEGCIAALRRKYPAKPGRALPRAS